MKVLLAKPLLVLYIYCLDSIAFVFLVCEMISMGWVPKTWPILTCGTKRYNFVVLGLLWSDYGPVLVYQHVLVVMCSS